MRLSPSLLLVLIAACSSSPPPAPDGGVDEKILAEKARRADEAIRERFLSPEGVLVYRRSLENPPDLRTGPYGDLSDAACWGGYLLGARALRLKATGTEDARVAVDRSLAGMEILGRATGVPGLFCRTVDRNLTEAELARRGGVWRPAAIPGYHFRGDVSKDQYAGILFGLGCVVRYVEDPEMRDRAGRLLIAIAEFFEVNGVAIAGRDGELTKHGDLSAFYLGAPLAVNAALALSAYRLSMFAGGPPEHRARYQELLARGYARSASHAKVSVLGKSNRNNDHMVTAGLFHLEALEEDPEVRELYRRGLARVAAGVKGEGNALFLGYHLVASGPRPELKEEAWAALAGLPVLRVSRPLDLRGKVEGVVPHALRPATCFTWRSDPYRLTWGPRGRKEPREYAPIDYLVAYWLLIAHGLTPT